MRSVRLVPGAARSPEPPWRHPAMSDSRSNRPPARKKDAASGPTDRTAPKGRKAGKPRKKPRTRKQRVLGVVKWLLIVGLVGALGLMGLFVIAYTSISIPDPNKAFQTQT